MLPSFIFRGVEGILLRNKRYTLRGSTITTPEGYKIILKTGPGSSSVNIEIAHENYKVRLMTKILNFLNSSNGTKIEKELTKVDRD